MTTTTRTTSKGTRRPAPQRTCASCRRVGDQSSFVRLVRVTDEAGTRVEVDEGRRKISGRGAYLCRDAACWDRGLKGALNGSLRTPIEPDNREVLRAYAARFASTPSTEDSAAGDSDQYEGEDA
jgi:predicted RNA-binding protein YlxR (DUF448 family)